MSATQRRTSVTAPHTPQTDPREQAMSDALERARAARAELQELRRRREEAIKRADAAIDALRSGARDGAKGDRVKEALDAVDRVTRIPTPGDEG